MGGIPAHLTKEEAFLIVRIGRSRECLIPGAPVT